MFTRAQRVLLALLVIACLVTGWVFQETIASIVFKWSDDTAYRHGFLIVPVVLWLAWQKRVMLAATALRPSWLGVPALVLCCAAWIVARGVGTLVIEQAAVVGMVGALTLAFLGKPATRVLIFPLTFVFFAVPFGRAVVPFLMELTADVASAALQWSGVPVYRTHMHIIIPGGWFEVARACSGINFFMAGLVLGVLCANLMFRHWAKRVLCVLAFVVIPILANGVRVYLTILLSHATDMRFGPGVEHVTLGHVFFMVVLVFMIWTARRWEDQEVAPAHSPPAPRAGVRDETIALAAVGPVLASLLIVLVTPHYAVASHESTRERLVETAPALRLPNGADGWSGPTTEPDGWRPRYSGSVLEQEGSYRAPDGRRVDVFVAVYGLGATLGNEMIGYGNVLFPGELASLTVDQMRELSLPSGGRLKVRETEIPGAGSGMLVWSWYMVGDRAATSGFAVKALEAASFLLRSADFERVVTVATPLDAGARDRLQQFVMAQEKCVAAGFAHEDCTG